MYESGRSCSHVRAGQARHHPVVVRGWVDRSLRDYWSPRQVQMWRAASSMDVRSLGAVKTPDTGETSIPDPAHVAMPYLISHYHAGLRVDLVAGGPCLTATSSVMRTTR